MNFALSLFDNEISPRFDCCTAIAFLSDTAKFKTAERVEFKGADGEERLRLILNRECNILLCGGIRKQDFLRLKAGGVHVIEGLSGDARSCFDEFKLSKDFHQHKAILKKQGGMMKTLKFNDKIYVLLLLLAIERVRIKLSINNDISLRMPCCINSNLLKTFVLMVI